MEFSHALFGPCFLDRKSRGSRPATPARRAVGRAVEGSAVSRWAAANLIVEKVTA